MKALSIRQPWAHALLHWGKDVENRRWKTGFRGPFLIHAAVAVDHDAVLQFGAAGYAIPARFDTGGIVGLADLVDCVTESTSPWFYGPFGFVIRNAKPLSFIPVRGRLNFFDVDLERRP